MTRLHKLGPDRAMVRALHFGDLPCPNQLLHRQRRRHEHIVNASPAVCFTCTGRLAPACVCPMSQWIKTTERVDKTKPSTGNGVREIDGNRLLSTLCSPFCKLRSEAFQSSFWSRQAICERRRCQVCKSLQPCFTSLLANT